MELFFPPIHSHHQDDITFLKVVDPYKNLQYPLLAGG